MLDQIIKKFSTINLNHKEIKPIQSCDVIAFENKHHFSLPPSLVSWLHFSNGSILGGGIFGINNGVESLQMEDHLQNNPAMKTGNCLPVAGDGCGNYFVINLDSTCNLYEAVFFWDSTSEIQNPLYIVASDFNHLLFFLIEQEKGVESWPFQQEYVLLHDSALAKFEDYLPWRNL